MAQNKPEVSDAHLPANPGKSHALLSPGIEQIDPAPFYALQHKWSGL
jgi:hypothetical protein